MIEEANADSGAERGHKAVTWEAIGYFVPMHSHQPTDPPRRAMSFLLHRTDDIVWL